MNEKAFAAALFRSPPLVILYPISLKNAMKLSTQVARNTIVQTAAKFVATGLGLAAVAIITRYLGLVGFGQYTTIVTFASFFAVAADMGITLITAQMLAVPGADQKKIIGNLFALRLISAAVFLGAAPLVVWFFPYDPIIKKGVAIAALTFFFSALNQVPVGLFQKNLRMEKAAVAEVAGRVLLVVAVAAAARFGFGLIGVMASGALASGFNFLLHYLFSAEFVRLTLRFDKEVWLAIARKSWPLALTIALNLIYLKTDTLILSLVKSQAEVGVYGAAYRVIDVVITVPFMSFMFAGLVLPIITAEWARQRTEKFKSIMQRSFDAMAVLAVPLVVGAQFTAEPLMKLVAGDDFGASGGALRVLSAAAAAIFLGSAFTHGVIAIDKQKKIIGAYAFVGVTAVLGYLIFIPKYSYFGAAWVTVYSEAAVAAASAFLVWKYAKFSPSLKVFAKSAAASAVMGIWLYFVQKNYQMNLFAVLIAATAVYLTALYAFKGISKQDLADLMNKR